MTVLNIRACYFCQHIHKQCSAIPCFSRQNHARWTTRSTNTNGKSSPQVKRTDDSLLKYFRLTQKPRLHVHWK